MSILALDLFKEDLTQEDRDELRQELEQLRIRVRQLEDERAAWLSGSAPTAPGNMLLAEALEALTEGFVLFDANERLVLCNSRYREIYHEIADRLAPGVTLTEVARATAEHCAGLQDSSDIEAWVRARVASHRDLTGPTEQQLGDNCRIRVSEHRLPNGWTAGLRIDISETRQAEQALVMAKQQADIANRAKSEFLANMSHELRTPLNAIIGFAEIIGEEKLGPIEPPKYREYVKDIHHSGQHLLDLINDILDLSKIEVGSAQLDEQEVDAPGIVQSCLRLMAERAKNGELKLSTDLADDASARLYADPRMLKQILINLLSNAIKFTPAGGQVLVTLRMATESGCLLAVTDTGIGMAPEDMPRALERFQQIENPLTRRYHGSGLGLPLTKALVDLHGGTLDLQSRAGAGTTVTVRFPADRMRTVVKDPAAG